MIVISILLSTMAIQPITTKITTLIPPHKPSNPSIKLTALVIPTIHMIVNTIERAIESIVIPKGKRKTSTPTPKATKMKAAHTSNASFTKGFISIRSSIKPAKNIKLPPKIIPLTAISAFTNKAIDMIKET